MISAWTSTYEREPSKRARIGARALGTVSTASVTPEGSRRQMTSRSSTRVGNASTGRSCGVSDRSVTTRQESHRRGGVAASGFHQFGYGHVLVHLMRYQPIPRAERHDRNAKRGAEDRPVGGSGDAAEDGPAPGNLAHRPLERPDDRFVALDAGRGPGRLH